LIEWLKVQALSSSPITAKNKPQKTKNQMEWYEVVLFW
jgi:hypothetical protein